MTIQTARAWARDRLKACSDAPHLDADWLLLHILGQSDISFLTIEQDQHLQQSQEAEFAHCVHERASGVPLAYITGEAHFYGRVFRVTRDVLIPRPATEDLVSQGCEAIRAIARRTGKPLIVADIGTGSGCVAAALLLECSDEISHVYATDTSKAALSVAADNAKGHNVDDRITFLQGSLLEPLLGKPIDLIVSNPPYVPTAELDKPATIETAGLRFEPRQALDGGEDGLLYVNFLQASGIPSVIETLQGKIIMTGV